MVSMRSPWRACWLALVLLALAGMSTNAWATAPSDASDLGFRRFPGGNNLGISSGISTGQHHPLFAPVSGYQAIQGAWAPHVFAWNHGANGHGTIEIRISETNDNGGGTEPTLGGGFLTINSVTHPLLYGGGMPLTENTFNMSLMPLLALTPYGWSQSRKPYEPQEDYYWQINMWEFAGMGGDYNAGPIWSFNTNRAPNQPTIISPENNGTNIGTAESYTSSLTDPVLIFGVTDEDTPPNPSNNPSFARAFFASVWMIDRRDPWRDPSYKDQNDYNVNLYEITDFDYTNGQNSMTVGRYSAAQEPGDFADIDMLAGPFYSANGHYRPTIDDHVDVTFPYYNPGDPYNSAGRNSNLVASPYRQPDGAGSSYNELALDKDLVALGGGETWEYLMGHRMDMFEGNRFRYTEPTGFRPDVMQLWGARKPLVRNKDYVWRVRVFDGDLWSAPGPSDGYLPYEDKRGGPGFQYPWKFTTSANDAPETAFRPFPPDYRSPRTEGISAPPPESLQVSVSPPPTLTWISDDPNGDPVTFDVYFGTEFAPPLVASNVALARYTPASLQSNQRYYWYIVTRDQNGGTQRNTAFSQVSWPLLDEYPDNAEWSFLTNNQPPEVPKNEDPDDPVDDATGAGNDGVGGQRQTINWAGEDIEGDTVYFDVLFGTDDTPDREEYTDGESELVSNRTTTRSWQPPYLLQVGQTYHWQIIAYNVIKDSGGTDIVLGDDDAEIAAGADEMIEGPVWSFTVQNMEPEFVDDVNDLNDDEDDWPGSQWGHPSPTHNATDDVTMQVPLKLDLGWECSDADLDSLIYRVYVDKGANASVDYTTGLLYSASWAIAGESAQRWVEELDPNTWYEWWVEVTDEPASQVTVGNWAAKVDLDDGSGDCPHYKFRTGNRAPDLPTAAFPAHQNGSVNPYEPNIYWNCTHPDDPDVDPFDTGDANDVNLTFDVYFGTSNNPPLISSGHTANQLWAPTPTDPNTVDGDNVRHFTWLIAPVLRPEQRYFWRVTARDGLNSTVGPLWEFTTINRPPNLPVPISPLHQAIGVASPTPLDWDCVDPDGDSLTYSVYFGASSNPPVVATALDQSAYNGLLGAGMPTQPNNRYYWRVIANDGHGNSVSSDSDLVTAGIQAWRFDTNKPPTVPHDLRPSIRSEDDAVNASHPTSPIDPLDVITSPPPKLSWACEDPEEGALTYDVYFGATSPPVSVSTGQTATEWTPNLTALRSYTQYWWQVVAHDNSGGATQAPVVTFTTGNLAPNAPGTPDPANDAVNVSLNPTLSWTCTDPEGDPIVYDVLFGIDSTPDMDDTVDGTSELKQSGRLQANFSPTTLLVLTDYYWQIRAIDQHGAATFSPVWHFTTIDNPPDKPTAVNPADGAVDEPLTTTLQWGATDPENESLTFDVYFGEQGSAIIVAADQAELTFDVPVAPATRLKSLTTYEWYIVSRCPHGAETTSDVFTFTTLNNPPTTPSNPAPATLSVGVLPAILDWVCDIDLGDGITDNADPDGDVVVYDVYFGEKPSPAQATLPASMLAPERTGLTETQCPLPDVDELTDYVWQVEARDVHDAASRGPVWEFSTPNLYVVTGTLTEQGTTTAIAGATVDIFDATDTLIGATVSANDGSYTLTDLIAGDYTVIPTSDDWTFIPPSIDVTLGPNDGTANFVATPVTYEISGTVTDTDGVGIAGVRVVVVPGTGVEAVTDADGNYTVSGIKSGTRTATPVHEEYTFEPVNERVVLPVSGAPEGAATGIDFVGTPVTYTVSGTVYDFMDPVEPLPGVEVEIRRMGETDPVASATTGDDGTYLLPDLTYGNYEIGPVLDPFAFADESGLIAPVQRILNTSTGDLVDVDFYQTFLAVATEIELTPDTATAEPRATTSLTVTVRDQLGDGIEGVAVTVNTSGSSVAPITNQSVTTNVAGQAPISVVATPGTLGESTVTVVVTSAPTLTAEATIAVAWRLPLGDPLGTRNVHLVSVPAPFDPGSMSPQPPVARYLATEGRYEVYADGNFVMQPGKGYVVQADEDIVLSGDEGSLFDTGGDLVVPLGHGWTLLGNPRLRDLTWSLSTLKIQSGGQTLTLAQAVTNGLIEPYGWAWDADTDQYVFVADNTLFSGANNTLPKYRAMFIRTLVGGLAMEFPAATAASAAVATASVRGESDWIARIVAQGDGIVDRENYFGVSTAPLTRGGLQVSSPPLMGDSEQSIELAFAPADGASGLAVDIRDAQAEEMVWNGVVTARGIDGTVALTWDDLRQLPRDYIAVLQDGETGKRTSMRTATSYAFGANADGVTVREFSITIARRISAGLQVRMGEASVRSRGATFDAVLQYTLTRDADVECIVRNAAGRVVATIPAAQVAAGVNTLAWNGKSDVGAAVPAGQYIVEIQAVSDDGQKSSAIRTINR